MFLIPTERAVLETLKVMPRLADKLSHFIASRIEVEDGPPLRRYSFNNSIATQPDLPQFA
jgi:hypothetical protein